MKIARKFLIVSFCTAIIVGGFLFWQRYFGRQLPIETNDDQVIISIAGKEFQAEVADSSEERELGLSGRSGMCQDCAMLFEFPAEGIYPFWMRGMRFDLDIIWVEGNEIVAIERNVSYTTGNQKTFNPGINSNKVIELNAGLSDELGIKVGDRVFF